MRMQTINVKKLAYQRGFKQSPTQPPAQAPNTLTSGSVASFLRVGPLMWRPLFSAACKAQAKAGLRARCAQTTSPNRPHLGEDTEIEREKIEKKEEE